MSTLFSHFFEKINQISPLEANFTEVLDSIAVKPKILYFRGKMPQNIIKIENQRGSRGGPKATSPSTSSRPKTVAIVGSRHNTRYGEEVAYKLAYELGLRGVVVVSGLAYGIDSIGHRGCLDAGGVTVAVLGTPIDQIYPKEHLGLAKEIIEKGGAIISEYAPRLPAYQAAPLAPGEAGWDGERWIGYTADGASSPQEGQFIKRQVDPKLSFLQRNRLISGLSDIVVVVEAATKSGTLSTATHALAQGREVFAVPGNITSPYSQGCNKLISQGAIPYAEPDDVLRVLFPDDYTRKCRHLKQAKLFGDTDAETAVIRALAAGARKGDDIMQLSLLPAEVFNQTITLLELKSRVRSLGLNNWSLA